MPIEKRGQMLNDILQHSDWIIDGVYYAWVQKSFEDADVIYVLDMPKWLYRFRIIKRFIRRRVGLEKGKKETLKSVYTLLKWTEYKRLGFKQKAMPGYLTSEGENTQSIYMELCRE